MILFIYILSVLLPMSRTEPREGCYLNDGSSSSASDADLTCVSAKLTGDKLKVLHPDEAEVVNLIEVEADLDKNVLKSLTGLKSLLMYKCNIGKFEPESSQLQTLNMHYVTLPGETNFDKCCRNLKKLMLRNITGIDLQRSVFAKLNRLQQLQLSHISSDRLNKKIFAGLNSLRKLRISNMNFETSDGDSFSELTHLKELYLEEEEIFDIHRDVFKPLKSLKVLTIYAKQLKALPLEMFNGLSELREIGLPLRTWREMDVTKVPEMFPKLTSFSYTEEWEWKDRDLYKPLFKKLNLLLLSKQKN